MEVNATLYKKAVDKLRVKVIIDKILMIIEKVYFSFIREKKRDDMGGLNEKWGMKEMRGNLKEGMTRGNGWERKWDEKRREI